jgi:hypothetical protein
VVEDQGNGADADCYCQQPLCRDKTVHIVRSTNSVEYVYTRAVAAIATRAISRARPWHAMQLLRRRARPGRFYSGSQP